MIKTLKQVLSEDRESMSVPSSVQDTVPVKRIYGDGIFAFGNKYSKTYCFSDINYSVASKDDQMAMFLEYCEFLNSLEVGATTKITINNRRQSPLRFEGHLLPLLHDGLDSFRNEYNAMLMEKASAGSGISQEKYITVSVCKKSYEEARTFFSRIGAEMSARLGRLSSRITEPDIAERLRIFHDFYRPGCEDMYCFSLKDCMKKGHSFKDCICPDGMSVKPDYIRIGPKYARVLYLSEYPSYIRDSMITEMCELNKSLMLSMDIIPVPTDEAVREVEAKLLGTETNIGATRS